MEVACKDAFDQCVGRMVCQLQRDGRLVNDYIRRLRNNCFTGCGCHVISSLLNNVLLIERLIKRKQSFPYSYYQNPSRHGRCVQSISPLTTQLSKCSCHLKRKLRVNMHFSEKTKHQFGKKKRHTLTK